MNIFELLKRRPAHRFGADGQSPLLDDGYREVVEGLDNPLGGMQQDDLTSLLQAVWCGLGSTCSTGSSLTRCCASG
jgi:hypothetical protein